MSMAIIGVAGTVIGAGATAYSAYSQSQAGKGGGTGGAEKNVGTKPKAAEYRPVDFQEEQKKTIQGNLANMWDANKLMNWTNNFIDADALRRVRKFIPGFEENMKLEGNASHSLLQGQLPYDDVLDVVAKGSELGGAIGTPGASSNATLRDLGLSRLSAIQSGAGLMRGMVDIAETVNPVGRRMTPQQMYLNPETAIRNRMEQNQLIQQSDQNRNNIEAAPTPAQALQAQVGLSNAQSGGGGGGDIGGYASALQGLIGGLGKAYASSGGGGAPSGTYSGMFAQNPVAGVKNQIYRPSATYGIAV